VEEGRSLSLRFGRRAIIGPVARIGFDGVRRAFGFGLAVLLPALTACSSSDEASPPRDAGHEAPPDGGAPDGGAGGADAGSDAADASEAAVGPTVILPKTGLDPAELAVLVNDSDPQSTEVADYYQSTRSIPAANVVHLSFAVSAVMSEADFTVAKALVDALPLSVQGLVVTWTQPYRVECMSTTSAFALGFDHKYCNDVGGCAATASVDYFDSDSVAPFADHGIRPAMMLAAKDAAGAKALVDRGVAADDTFPTGDGYMVRTTDSARSVRFSEFVSVESTWTHPEELKLTYIDNSDGSGKNTIDDTNDVLFYFTGLASVPNIDTDTYRPGAVADHLTSFGGQVPTSGQMSVVAWLEAGATASYGTVVEPCNYTSKFPDPRVLVPRYYRGGTVLEAYWKSVLAPGEGLFVGEPLARPWGTSEVSFANGTLSIVTTALDPAHTYALEAADSASGPFSTALADITVPYYQRATITLSAATATFYRLSEVN
jgi:uncharacterized protein (TIGR03790 family)